MFTQTVADNVEFMRPVHVSICVLFYLILAHKNCYLTRVVRRTVAVGICYRGRFIPTHNDIILKDFNRIHNPQLPNHNKIH